MIEITSLSGEAAGVAQAAAIGIIMGVYYDLFRILRRLFHFNYATIVFQDLFFFITSAIPVFFAVCYMCGGIIRIYIVVLVLLCAVLYCSTFGTLVVFAVSWILKTIFKMITSIYDHTFKVIFSKMFKSSRNLIIHAKKVLIKCPINKKTS